MSETPGNELELRQEPREVATIDTDSWSKMAAPIFHLAQQIANTEFVPRGLRGKAPAAAAAMLYGREVGLPPMTALNSTHVIEGSPSLSAEMMRALVLSQGHELEFTQSTGAVCTVRGRRRGSDGEYTAVTWTTDMARAAGLMGKDNWKKYPRRMLQARASAELCELIFPDVIHGFRSTEEMEDHTDGDGPEEAAAGTQPVKRAARKRAPVKRADAPQAGVDEVPLPGEGEVPLPDELDVDAQPTDEPDEQGPDDSAGDAQPADSGAQNEAGAPSPAPDSAAAAEGDAGALPTDEAVVDAADSEAPASPDPDPALPDEEGVYPAEVVGEEPAPPPAVITGPQKRMIHASLNAFGFEKDDRDNRLAVVSTIVGRVVETTNDLTKDEARGLIDTLGTCQGSRAKLDALVQGILAVEGGGQS